MLLPSSARADPLGQRLGSVHFGAMEIGGWQKGSRIPTGKFYNRSNTRIYTVDFMHTCMHIHINIYTCTRK